MLNVSAMARGAGAGAGAGVLPAELLCQPRARANFWPAWPLVLAARVADFLAIIGAGLLSGGLLSTGLLSSRVFSSGGAGFYSQWPLHGCLVVWALLVALLVAVGGQFSFGQAQLYRTRALVEFLPGVHSVTSRWSFMVGLLAGGMVLGGGLPAGGRAWFACFYGSGLALVLAERFLIARFLQAKCRAGVAVRSVIIMADSAQGTALETHFKLQDPTTHVAAIFTSKTDFSEEDERNVAELLNCVKIHKPELVILAICPTAQARIDAIVLQLREEAVPVYLWPGSLSIGVSFLPRCARLPALCLIPLAERSIPAAGIFIKTVFDRLFAFCALLACAPLFLACAGLVAASSKGPVFFRQERVGYKNRCFYIYKFRTMKAGACQDATPVSRDDARMFPAGRWLRKLSLDELPQLINVLRGDMSLVGPRPHMVGHAVDKMECSQAIPGYAARHCVKPGITGWAQVNGWRGPADTVAQMQGRLAHDMYYIENWSIMFDLFILLKTICFGFYGENVF